MLDTHPQVDWSDDDIRHYVKQHGPHLPIVYVPLGGAITDQDRNLAEVRCCDDGWPVTRWNGC